MHLLEMARSLDDGRNDGPVSHLEPGPSPLHQVLYLCRPHLLDHAGGNPVFEELEERGVRRQRRVVPVVHA